MLRLLLWLAKSRTGKLGELVAASAGPAEMTVEVRQTLVVGLLEQLAKLSLTLEPLLESARKRNHFGALRERQLVCAGLKLTG